MLRHVAYWVTVLLFFPAMVAGVLLLGAIPAVVAYALIIPLAIWACWWADRTQRKEDAERRLG